MSQISSEEIHSGISSSLPTLVKQRLPVERTGFDNTFSNSTQRCTSECWSLHSSMFFMLVRRKHLTGEKDGMTMIQKEDMMRRFTGK